MSATLVTPKTTSGGEIVRELVNASDGQGLHLEDGGKIDLGDVAAAKFGTSDFSVEFVLNQTGENSIDNYIYFSNANGNNRVYFRNDLGENLFRITFWDSGGTQTAKDIAYDMAADYNTPTHYVVTFDRDGDATLYKNGNSVGSVDISAFSSINLGDGNANVQQISSGANYGVLGTFYRFRTYNKLVDAKALYERADVDFADQYGSQTKLIDSDFNGSYDGWNSSNSWNSQTNPSNNLVLAASSINQACRTSTQLTAFKKYRVTYTASSVSGTPGFGYITTAGAFTNLGTITEGTGNTLEFYYDSNYTTKYFYIGAFSSDAAVTLDDISVVQIGAVVDMDLAFASPTQSLTVQDRAGLADGTCSASGVTQVQPVVQLNSTSARIGTSAATPADGEVIASKIVVQTADAGIGPSDDADELLLENTGNAGMTILSGNTSDAAIYFGDGDAAGRGRVNYDNNDDSLKLYTAAATRVTIDSSGAVAQSAVNSGGDVTSLQLRNGAAATSTSTSLRFVNSTVATATHGGAELTSVRNANDGGSLVIKTAADTSTTLTERLTIDSTGLATFNNGIAFSQINTTATGATATGTTLSHFEEGTWTPSITTGAGESITYANQVGKYTRIGDIVTVSGYIKITSSATYGSSTHWLITGLPFGGVSGTTAGGTFSYGAIYNTNPLTTTTDISAGQVNTTNGTSIYLSRGGKGGTSDVFAKTSALNTTGTLTFSLVYKTADA